MKRTYIQPEVKTHRLKLETSFMAGVSKGFGDDYAGKEFNPEVSEEVEYDHGDRKPGMDD